MGATVVGRISDQTVIKWRRKRKGLWYPEDRLRAALIPFAIIVPISVLTFGLVNKFVDGNLGLVLCLMCLFSTGVGVSGTNTSAGGGAVLHSPRPRAELLPKD